MIARSAIIGLALSLLAGSALAQTWVEGHFRRDGSYAPGHYRRDRSEYSTSTYSPYRAPRQRRPRAPRGDGSIYHPRVDQYGMPRLEPYPRPPRRERSGRSRGSIYNPPSDFRY